MAEEELLTEADKASKHNKKFEKDGDTDITAGPRKKGRWCTDVPCCLLFVAHIGLFWYVSFSGFETGNYEKLYLPRDYRGQYCGLDGDWQWESDMNLESFEKQSWTMNITRMFDTVARTLVCGQTGYSVLVGSEVGTPAMTDATFESYCGATHSLTDTLETIASDMTGYVESQVTQFTDPSKAADFLTGDFGEDPFTQVLKTFHKVCASTCGTTQNASENMRSWDYIPDWDISWNGNRDFHASTIWSEFRTQIRDSTATGSAIDTLRQQLTSFRFKALPVSICPYEPQFCVPMPGASFEELSDFNYCTPKVDTSILTDSQAGEVAWQSLNEVAELDVTEDLSSTFGSAWGDVLKTWDVLLIVCVASFVAALVWLILLRFALGPMVWLSIFLCFAIFLAGGVICIARANQCADQGLFESAKSQADAASQQGDSGDNPFERECPGGYSVQGSEIRDLLQICGYVLFALAGVFLLSVICLFCRIRLAIALCKVALQFIYHNPSVLFIPIVQTIIGIIWVVAWTVCTAYLTSSVPDDYVGDRKYSNYDSGSVDCTEEWPAGFVWKDSNSTDCQSDEIGCWKCALPRFILDARFAYSLFSLFWHNCFFVALGQMVLAGAAAIWFFTPREEKGRGNVVLPSLGICLYYHTGTVAFGSLLLAIIKLIKWFLRFLAKQAKAQHNMVMAIVFKCLAYAVWCFEKCVRFLNKNAYIQTALLGTNFLVSAMRAFYLIARNAIRFLVLAGLSHIITMVSKAFIVVATGALGYLILWAMYPEVNAILPTIIYCAIGWMVANLFMNVKEMAVDTMLQCFIATEEMGGDSGFVPNGLKKFVDEKAEEGDGNKGCCCGCWGCTCCC